jgi:hypothetical protein
VCDDGGKKYEKREGRNIHLLLLLDSWLILSEFSTELFSSLCETE